MVPYVVHHKPTMSLKVKFASCSMQICRYVQVLQLATNTWPSVHVHVRCISNDQHWQPKTFILLRENVDIKTERAPRQGGRAASQV